MGLKEMLRAFLDHRRDVLQRRSAHRLAKIEQRLEVLEGLLIVYLNIDEVIRIIRYEDDPKAVMMKRFRLSEIQAEAILNMRLRQLRKLEEMEIKREHEALREEQKGLQALSEDARKQWRKIAGELKEARKLFGPGTSWASAAPTWRSRGSRHRGRCRSVHRARAGHGGAVGKGLDPRAEGPHQDLAELKFKEGDHALHSCSARPPTSWC